MIFSVKYYIRLRSHVNGIIPRAARSVHSATVACRPGIFDIIDKTCEAVLAHLARPPILSVDCFVSRFPRSSCCVARYFVCGVKTSKPVVVLSLKRELSARQQYRSDHVYCTTVLKNKPRGRYDPKSFSQKEQFF